MLWTPLSGNPLRENRVGTSDDDQARARCGSRHVRCARACRDRGRPGLSALFAAALSGAAALPGAAALSGPALPCAALSRASTSGLSGSRKPGARLSGTRLSGSGRRTGSAGTSLQSGLRPPRGPARRNRQQRRRPEPRGADQARRGRHRQAAGRSRPHAGACAAGRLWRPGFLLAVLRPVAAMRAAEYADPADARQPRPHDQRSRAAQERQQRPPVAAPGGGRPAGAEQLRRAVSRDGACAPPGPFRTVCVRTCDGFYFPTSYSPLPSRFADDDRACHRLCPAADVMLFSYRTPGEEVTQAVSVSGQQYTAVPNAFRYRKELVSSCSCKRPGENWAEALRNTDDASTLENGDIVVNEKNEKALAQPRGANGKPLVAGAPANANPAPAPDGSAATSQPGETTTKDANGRNVRVVGPPFISR